MKKPPLGRRTKLADDASAARSRRCGTLLILLLLTCSAPGQALGQDTSATPSQGYIYSLLIDKQAPTLGIKWGGEVFVDTPLNGEPENANLTLRKAKLSFQKAFNRNWLGKLTLNYHTVGGFELGDNYLRYSGWQTAIARAGVFSPPFSLESVSSASGLTFMERSLAVDALSEGNSAGVGFLKRTPNSILNAALFFFSPKHEDVAQTGQALVLRYVHSPIEFSRLGILHLGGSLSYRINAKPDETELSTRPEVATTDDYYVDTGAIDAADKVTRFGLEANKQAGRFSWQSELLATSVQRQGKQKVSFWGAYTYVSWFLTDDSRNYDAGTGEFNAVVPNHPLGKGGKGAFELALRASYVDLTDKDVIGGEQSNITLGLNWYINKRFRLMTNLVKVLDVKRPGSEYDGLDPLIFSLRFQWLMQ